MWVFFVKLSNLVLSVLLAAAAAAAAAALLLHPLAPSLDEPEEGVEVELDGPNTKTSRFFFTTHDKCWPKKLMVAFFKKK